MVMPYSHIYYVEMGQCKKDVRNSSALAMELRLSFTNPQMYSQTKEALGQRNQPSCRTSTAYRVENTYLNQRGQELYVRVRVSTAIGWNLHSDYSV